jgi:UDP-glucose:(heptosyl)LPS alpha-1,3-glucosyltransferase
MRVALLKHRFVGFGGGAERYHTGLFEQLRKRGHEIHIFAAHWDARAEAQPWVLHRVRVIGGESFLGQLTFALASRKAVQRGRCDIVFGAERTLYQDICRAGGGCHREWLCQRRRYATWLKGATLWCNPLHPTLLWLERRTFSARNTRFIIANSHRGKQEIIRHYGFPAERIVVIHNGVDCERFKPVDRVRRRDEFVLLFVGSGFERKGLRFCMEALARLPPHVRLIVAGKGNRRPYERLAARLGVMSRVEFLGATPNVDSVYPRGDLLVHPAIYEPFSNACLEAMACGLPVVTSQINGAAEVIVPGGNGMVVADPGDSESLAAAIRPFLDREFLENASARARQTAESLSLSLNVERTLEVFRRLRNETEPGKTGERNDA